MESRYRVSTKVLFGGLVVAALGGLLFWWGMTTTYPPAQGMTRDDMVREIGKMAGGIVGIGGALALLAVALRLRGR